jgi:GR25 family glycosyltransferase involved in LPS biosynthesis
MIDQTEPVLFLTFNRLETTKEVFEKIKEYQPSRLYLASDGPRADKLNEKNSVLEIRDFLTSNINWECDVRTRFLDQNLGCKYGVSSAIDWFFQNEDQGIILEDDCLPNRDFFTFCEKMLNEFQKTEKISMISGGNFDPRATRNNLSGFDYSQYSIIWGWASWADRWNNQYDPEMGDWLNIRSTRKFKKMFSNKRELTYWTRIFDKMFEGKFDTWDYQWHYCNLKHNRLSIIPTANYISNIGADVDPTHLVSKTEVHERSLDKLKPILIDDTKISPKANKKYDKRIRNLFFNKSIARRLELKIKQLFSENKS